MSAGGSIKGGHDPALHPVVAAASGGLLPSWARIDAPRRAHVARVVALMDEWAVRLGLVEAERRRWRAVAWLHDSLRNAGEAELRGTVGARFRDWPFPLLHGPAAAARLAREGVTDGPLLLAVAFHTLGHPDFDEMAKALYLADYLEPGRAINAARNAALRAVLPEALPTVLLTVAAERVAHSVRSKRLLRPETVAFWNGLVAGDRREASGSVGAVVRLRDLPAALTGSGEQ